MHLLPYLLGIEAIANLYRLDIMKNDSFDSLKTEDPAIKKDSFESLNDRGSHD